MVRTNGTRVPLVLPYGTQEVGTNGTNIGTIWYHGTRVLFEIMLYLFVHVYRWYIHRKEAILLNIYQIVAKLDAACYGAVTYPVFSN